jgi:hypothetical protein
MEFYEAMRTTFAAMIGIGKAVEDFTWVDTFAGGKFDG